MFLKYYRKDEIGGEKFYFNLKEDWELLKDDLNDF